MSSASWRAGMVSLRPGRLASAWILVGDSRPWISAWEVGLGERKWQAREGHPMKVDFYMRFVLTVIAVCLIVIVVRDVRFVREAQAYGQGESVIVSNLETDVRMGETLYVYCKNCP